jgi:hypothetical protein
VNVRWIAITLFCSGAYVLGCGSESKEERSPCTTVCNCVAKEAGENARGECLSQCASVRGSSTPVQACRDRLATNGITSCDAACFAFGDDEIPGSGGSSNTGGAIGPSPSGGAGGASGGSGPAGGAGGGVGTGNRSSSGGVSGTGGTGPVAGSPIGRACSRDADCGSPGVRCLTSTSSDLAGAGPPNGYCAGDCTEGIEACAALDPSSVCVRFETGAGTAAFCLERCRVGGAQVKCHNRPDVACDDAGGPVPAGGEGFCRPTCRGDVDCGVRRCDLGSGFCVDEPLPAGALPIGSPCNPAATTESCNGACFPLTNDPSGPGMCGGLCTLGAVGCGEEPNTACLFALSDANPGRGDLGLCGQLCNCDDDCTANQRVCRPFPADEAQAAGFLGYCGGAVDPSGAATDHLACN